MSVNPVSSAQAPPPEPARPPGQLGRDEFLKLLVAQMSYQDPLEPMSGTEFVAQLAQFSGVEQLLEVNRQIELLALGQSAIANAQVAGLIGREITARADAIEIGDGPTPPVRFDLASDATSVTVTITDESGRVVRTLDAGALAAGAHEVAWDGRDADGAALPPGTYRVSVAATGADGQPVEASARVRGVVTGVTFESGYPELLVGSVHVRLGDVLDIAAAPNAGTTP